MPTKGLRADLARFREWYAEFGRRTFGARDFQLGCFFAGLVGAATGINAAMRSVGFTMFLGLGALDVALLAVVLTALAILVGLLDATYLRVLKYAGGMRGAATPYKTIAFVAGVGTVVSAVSALLWRSLPWYLRASTLALAVGLSVWVVWGTVQLVALTARHGAWRAQLMDLESDTRAKLREIKNAS